MDISDNIVLSKRFALRKDNDTYYVKLIATYNFGWEEETSQEEIIDMQNAERKKYACLCKNQHIVFSFGSCRMISIIVFIFVFLVLVIIFVCVQDSGKTGEEEKQRPASRRNDKSDIELLMEDDDIRREFGEDGIF